MSKLRTDELVNKEGDGSPSFPYGATSTEPTLDNQVATKSYVDNSISGSLGNVVSSTAPASPAIGTFWTDTSVSPSLLKVWNGSVWLELSGEVSPYTGFIGSPVEVLTPLDGAGVGGAYNYVPRSDVVNDVQVGLRYGGFSGRHQMGLANWDFSGIAYGNGTWVFLPENYTQEYGIPYSTNDGFSWNQGFPPSSNGNWKKIIFNGNKFVILAQSTGYTHIAHSADGVTWVPANMPYEGGRTSISFIDIAFNPDSGRIIVTTWAQYNNGKGYLYSDDDGSTWTHVASAQSQMYPKCIEYGNGVWVVPPSGGNNRAPEYSTDDGLTWQVGTGNNDNFSCEDICYDPDLGVFVAPASIGSSHYLWKSYNGINWSYSHWRTDNNYQFRRIAYGNGRYFLWHEGYNQFATSTNGSSWSMTNISNEPNWGSQNRPNVFYWSEEANRWATATSYDGYSFLSDVGGDWSFNYYRYLTADVTLNSENIYKKSDDSLVEGETPSSILDTTLKDSTTGEYLSLYTLDGTSMRFYSISHRVDQSFNYTNARKNITDGTTIERYNNNGEVTVYGPSPTEIVFTSQNANTTPVSATDATVAFRKWTLETRASSSDPWTLVVESDDYDIVASQDGSTPWSASPTLQPNTSYRVKVSYHSSNAETIESVYSTFETGPAS